MADLDPGTPIQTIGFDHIVLNVADPEKSLEFYCGTLGLEPVRAEEWRRNEVRFPSIRVNRDTIIDLFQVERTGENLNHFCLVIEPTDFDAVIASGRFSVRRGPSDRFGARGVGHALEIVDPDGNLIELRYYG